MATEGHSCADEMVTEGQYTVKIKVVFLKAKEDLIDFLKKCKISGSLVMLCPICSVVFDKNVEGFQPHSKRKGKWADKRPNFSLTKEVFLTKIHLQPETKKGDK